MRILFTLFFLLFAGWAEAQDNSNLLGEISNSYMSPYCPGRTISSCPSPDARDLRSEISAWVDAGKSKAEIIAALESRYGEVIYPSPKQGAGKTLKYFPFVIVLLGLAICYVKLKGLKNLNTEKSETKASKPSNLEEGVNNIIESRFT